MNIMQVSKFTKINNMMSVIYSYSKDDYVSMLGQAKAIANVAIFESALIIAPKNNKYPR